MEGLKGRVEQVDDGEGAGNAFLLHDRDELVIDSVDVNVVEAAPRWARLPMQMSVLLRAISCTH